MSKKRASAGFAETDTSSIDSVNKEVETRIKRRGLFPDDFDSNNSASWQTFPSQSVGKPGFIQKHHEGSNPDGAFDPHSTDPTLLKEEINKMASKLNNKRFK